MVPQVTASRGLETLPARPPTPPREKQTEAHSTSRQTRARRSLLTRSDIHTPPSYSPDSVDSGNLSSRRTRKKVGFLAEPHYQEPPTYSAKGNGPKQPTPLTAPSSTGSNRPIKSILKPSAVPNPLDPSTGSGDENRQVNIAAMLESTVKQLAGADRQSKLDAYMMLVQALKASNNLPDRIALQEQMGLFTQFIQRDITTKNAAGTIDSSLANHALTLLHTFLYFPAIASTLSHDFGVFVIDHCIRCFEDPSMPKDVIRHLMQVVASQDFSPKVMAADRVGRLIAALHKIEEHLKGKSIIMSRIIIYRRLIKQSKSHMVSHSDWLLDLFTDMLSSMKEIRTSAVALGFEVAFTIGKEKQLSRRVMETLQLTVGETNQLQRKVPVGKQQEELRRVVFGSICNLYYYAFKPNSTSAQIDRYWTGCVHPIFQRLTSSADAKQNEKSIGASSEILTQATTIVTGLLDSATPRLWKEDHVAENPLVRPDELPAVDPKWIRRNASKVFTVIEPIINKAFLEIASPSSPSHKLWRTLMSAVAAAASKEVKVSNDTANFMAHAFNLLLKIWSAGPQKPDGDCPQVFLGSTQAFISIMIESIGLLPFTETRLSMRLPDDESSTSLFRAVFTPFLMARAVHARIDLANELMRETLPVEALSPYGPWLFISEIIVSSMESSQWSTSSSRSGSGPTVGHEYREIVKHLERGVRSTPNLPWEHWESLFQLLVARVTDETGEAGCAIVVVEPLARAFLDCLSTDNYDAIPMSTWRGSVELIATAKQPRDRQALDAARRRIWGTLAAGPRSTSFDPFDSFYRLINRLLEISYTHSDARIDAEIAPSMLTEVAAFLTRCSRLLVFKSLTQLQPSICHWIRDTDGRYNSKRSSNLSDAVKMLWETVCELLTDPGTLENLQLDTIEPLLCAAFESKHRHIVNTVSIMWNRVFDQIDNIQYPEKLKTVFLSIRGYVDIVLPGLDASSYESAGQQPAFIESQDVFDVSNFSSSKIGPRNTPQAEPPSSSARPTPTGSVRLSLPKKQRVLEVTPDPIHFAAIDSSSPTHNAVKSQILTDRQREVRERQRETASLFPEIRSSPEKVRPAQQSGQPAAQVTELNHLEQVQSSTPRTNHRFEDYISSTPTPRRGQAAVMDDDQDMTDDIPSSPPDPRRNLLDKMKPRSRSGSMLDEYIISSSPPSGSPLPIRQGVFHEHTSRDQATHNNTHEDDLEGLPKKPTMEVTANATESEPVHVGKFFRDVVGLLPMHPEDGRGQNISTSGPSFERLTTSPSTAPLLQEAQETPKSDHEVFVDAPTSPVSHTSRKLRSADKIPSDTGKSNSPVPELNRSFEVSEGEERSMTRLIIELDSRKCEPVPRCPTESPEKPRGQQESSVGDCVTVEASDLEPAQSKARKTRSSQSLPSAVPPTSADGGSSQSSDGKSKRSRKRPSERAQGPSSKRRRHHKYMGAEDVDTVLDSQMPTVHEKITSGGTTSLAAEIDESIGREEMGGKGSSAKPLEYLPSQEAEVQERDQPTSPESSGSLDSKCDSDAVDLQLWGEASQEKRDLEWVAQEASRLGNSQPPKAGGVTEMELVEEDTEMANTTSLAAAAEPQSVQVIQETTTPERCSLEKIMVALQGGLDELRTATLSREEVYKIEDMFMDIKRELYLAESRGRQ
ncbi:hypothetical protein DL766_000643 [Monosporascus sp. MC13-8B]|uniref:Telomere-associated protein Rif1 N-terminal domain-containing protein n=1 Tax=Monosporascus cannonballus TaxID=155416 RepID=A0ABY0GRJ4_9PEZI|nr:hypothetical protein DL762_010468 [Monosporascus cannonballus]RYO89915.1 hypothetical protein DL763_005471 [Monosporascus cannonballus]RYP39003.1 hypothetical protein DL766_000643 [Monosporascus sp. MC13-8B]